MRQLDPAGSGVRQVRDGTSTRATLFLMATILAFPAACAGTRDLYSGDRAWGAAAGTLADCSSADEALPDSADGSVVASAADLLRYHQALRQGELLSERSWAAMRTVAPGISNGLAYLVGEGEFGRYEGSLGKAMGHAAANVYYLDHETYVVMLGNRSDVPLPLQALVRQWFAP